MKHPILMFAFSVLLSSCCMGNAALPIPWDPVQQMNQATVVLLGYDEDHEPAAICTGVWVTQIEILTAAHCVDLAYVNGDTDGEPIGKGIAYINRNDLTGQVMDNPKPTGSAIIVAVDEANDLALLSAGRDNHSVAEFELGDMRQGAPVWVMGHTFGLTYSLSGGWLSADRIKIVHGFERHLWQVVSGANYGNSGGGLWTEDGKLIGLCSTRIEDSALSFFIHRDEVLKFLKGEGIEP